MAKKPAALAEDVAFASKATYCGWAHVTSIPASGGALGVRLAAPITVGSLRPTAIITPSPTPRSAQVQVGRCLHRSPNGQGLTRPRVAGHSQRLGQSRSFDWLQDGQFEAERIAFLSRAHGVGSQPIRLLRSKLARQGVMGPFQTVPGRRRSQSIRRCLRQTYRHGATSHRPVVAVTDKDEFKRG